MSRVIGVPGIVPTSGGGNSASQSERDEATPPDPVTRQYWPGSGRSNSPPAGERSGRGRPAASAATAATTAAISSARRVAAAVSIGRSAMPDTYQPVMASPDATQSAV